MNFAPVADVDGNPRNPVIGDRSLVGSGRVAQRVVAFVGTRSQGSSPV